MKSRERITAQLLTHHFDCSLHGYFGENLNVVGFQSANLIHHSESCRSTVLSIPRDLDLVVHIETPHRKIAAILDPKQAGIDPTDYLDKKAA